MEDKVICNKSDLVNAADAIRSKLGVTDTYYVSELSSAIQSIETGGIVPSGTISITENGTVDVIQYASAEVNVNSSPSLQSKSVTYTANGTATITPDEGYDGLSSVDVTVDVSGGGSETQAGRSVTFPATATRWTNIQEALLVISDGTSVHFEDYSVVAGKTINNVIAIRASTTKSYDFLKITMLIGAIVQIRNFFPTTVYMANAPGATKTFLGNSAPDVFIPIEDVTISAIEMYNTD